MKILFLALISLSLFASDVLTNYRLNGIESIEKHMDLELTSKVYWNDHLSKSDNTFGYIESYKNILTCNKDLSTLALYTKDTNNTYALKKKYNAFTGKEKGDKIKEGDLKTPIGVYNITKKLTKENKLNSFYGPLAFVTSYPNEYDKYRGKNGHGIWIHGLPTEQERDEFTQGCIAIDNPSIETLSENIDVHNTLLIINSDEVKQDVSREVLTSVLSELYSWRYSWLYDDIDAYLNFYSKDFIRFDGMDFDKFKTYKTRVFKKIEKKTIIFKDINVVPYPDTNNIYQITFYEYYKSDTFEFSGEKTLIVRLDKSNKMKILTEK